MKLHVKCLLAAAVLAVTVLAGCTTFRAEGLSMLPADTYKVVGHFDESVNIHKFLGSSGGTNLFNITADNYPDEVTNVISEQVKKAGGDGAANVSITYKAKFWQLLVNGITFSVWAPSTIQVSGDVVKHGN